MSNDKINNLQINVSNEFKTKIISELDLSRNGLKCTPKDAANIAEKILHIASDAGFYNGQATPAVKIIRAFGIELFRTNNMLQNISGVIYAGGRTNGFCISNCLFALFSLFSAIILLSYSSAANLNAEE